jgi:hypothetical protein
VKRILYVSGVPGRKHKALYINNGCVAHVLAYFRNDDDAETFMTWAREWGLTDEDIHGIPSQSSEGI